MYDRNVEFPQRYRLQKVDGTDDIFDLIPTPGEIRNEGTLINKSSLLKDATASLFGLGTSAVPDDVLSKIKTLIDSANTNANTKARIATGSYTGTNTYGASNPCRLTFDFVPQLVWIYSVQEPGGFVFNTTNQDKGVVVQNIPALDTGYHNYCGFCSSNSYWQESYGRKSSDGKSIYWYNTKYAFAQLNDSTYRYYYLAIG